ncbi:BatA domain-containing protein [Marinilongibacter aquaticus]|uniref:BatA domain-containing protein n=1 Tax=Marinilongibacter aquaticus TaxID=2975157 RepID=UPI0021BDDCF0|nr:BatA domain-containing protein [Marinilongibacter aquaticus]UBM60416.1 BatA domain-containing protein [Marinilongibacter aquaticus]
MQFANPTMLWGLLALAIPLIVHLFNFRKTRKVYFTNVALLKKVETETSSFRNIKHWLVMLCRMLFIVALVLAFAQPFIPAANSKSSAVKGMNSLYLDNSLSMENTTENKRYIDLAVLKLDELLSLFKNQQNVQFVSNNFSEDEQFDLGAAKIKERLTELSFSPKSRTLETVFARQKNLMHRKFEPEKSSYFWFSDFQKSTVGNLNVLSPDSSEHIYLVPVQGRARKNVFVDSVWLQSPFAREMQNTILSVKVSNSGNEEIENLPLKLFVDDVQTSTSSVSILPNGSAVASFNFTAKEKGTHKGYVSFDDQPITFDNESYFVINVSPAVRVLHVYDQKTSEEYVSKLFSNDSLFQFSSFSVRQIDPNRFQNYDFLIFEGIRNWTAELVQAGSTFLQTGGSVLCIPDAQMNVKAFNDFLAQNGGGQVAVSNAEPRSVGMQAPTKDEPFFADVFEGAGRSENLNLPEVKPISTWVGTGKALLTLKDGTQFLSRSSAGKGQLYVLAAPLSNAYGNFAEHALFVPTMFKMAALSLRPQALAYNFNASTIELPLQAPSQSAAYALKSEDTEFIPVQRVVGNTLILEMPDINEQDRRLESGFYDLMLEGQKVKTIALNHSTAESLMDQYTPEELRAIFSQKENVTVFDNILDSDFVSSYQAQNFGQSLWTYFVYMALAFLLAEILLVRFWKVG